MKDDAAVESLAALAHKGRLHIFRLLVQAGDAGLTPGDIARRTGSLANSLSTNLKILAHAGLVRSQRRGRGVTYWADYDRMRGLLAYLVEDCCASKPELCAPLVALVSQPCPAEGPCA